MGDSRREIVGVAVTIMVFAVIIAVTFGMFSYGEKTIESSNDKLASSLEKVRELGDEAKDTPAPTAKAEVTDNRSNSTNDELKEVITDTTSVELQAGKQAIVNSMKPIISTTIMTLGIIIAITMVTKLALIGLLYYMPAEMRESEFGHYIMKLAGKEGTDATCTGTSHSDTKEKELDYDKIAGGFMEVASPGIASKVVMAVCREAKLGDNEWQNIIKAMQGSNSIDDWLSKTTDDTLSVGLMSMPCISIGPSDITRKEVLDTYNKAIRDINSGYMSIDGYNRYHSTLLSEFFVYRVWNCNREVVAEPNFSTQANDDVVELMKKYARSTDESEF